jgi:hypothetical protein
VAALLSYFHDLDSAEEAFQDSCIQALTVWPRRVRRAIRPHSASWSGEIRDRRRPAPEQEGGTAGQGGDFGSGIPRRIA